MNTRAMAEVVFQNLEGMIPELEDLERQGVFSKEELRMIIRRRTDFEYKLQKRVVEKPDLLAYLEYELNLDLLRSKRTKRLKLKRYSTAALSVTRRIHDIFLKAIQKFGNDLKLWMQYLDFCKKTNSVRALSKAYVKLIQAHANNPDVWIMAAKHEFEVSGNAENARKLMQRGLRNLKQSDKLWLEYFRLELMHVDKIKKRRKLLGLDGIHLGQSETDDQPKKMDEFLANTTARIVFQKAIETMPDDITLRIQFMDMCKSFEDVNVLEDAIYTSLEEDFPSDARTCQALALRQFNELEKDPNRIVKDEEWLAAELACTTAFTNATQTTDSEDVWTRFITTCNKLLKESRTPQQASRRMESLFEVFAGADRAGKMTVDLYIQWADVLLSMELEVDARACLEKSLSKFACSLQLWRRFIEISLKIDGPDFSSHLALLRKCLASVNTDQDRSVVWEMILDAAIACEAEQTDSLLQELMECRQCIREKVIAKFLNWISTSKGIAAVRKLFTRIQLEKVDIVLMKEFIQTEKEQVPVSRKWMRKLFEKVTHDFGNISADVWLEWLAFEQDGSSVNFEKIGHVFRAAKASLVEPHRSEFLTAHTLARTKEFLVRSKTDEQ